MITRLKTAVNTTTAFVKDILRRGTPPENPNTFASQNFSNIIVQVDARVTDRRKFASQLVHLHQLADPAYRSSYDGSVLNVVKALLMEGQTASKLAPVVLDFGCWSGTTTRYISDSLDAACVGAEIDQTCLAFGRAYFETPRVTFIGVTLDRIDCANECFDLVLANQVFANMFANLHERMVRELIRVTKPGGTIVILDSNNPVSREVQERLLSLYRLLEGDGGSYLLARRSHIDALCPATAPNDKAARETCYSTPSDIAAYLAGHRPASNFDPASLQAPFALTAPFAAPSTVTDPRQYAATMESAGLTVTVGPGYPSPVPLTSESSFVLVARKR